MDEISEEALEMLARAGRRAADGRDLGEALKALAEGVSKAAGADAVVIRTADAVGRLTAHTVVARSEALAAELAGSSFPLDELTDGETPGEELPAAVRRAAQRARATDILLLPARSGGVPLGSLELFRSRRRFLPGEAAAARFAASHIGFVLRAFESNGARGVGALLPRALVLAGDALAAGLDQARAAEEVVRIAARAAGAEAAVLWYPGDEGNVELLASSGPVDPSLADTGEKAAQALTGHGPVRLEREGGRPVATLTLGQPPVGVLQLVFPAAFEPEREDLDRLANFAVRAAQALRAGERMRNVSRELERAEALLAVVGQAIAELSVSHTLETTVDRVSELLRSDRVAVYLRRGMRLRAEAGRGASGAEIAVAERLLELAFGPLRAQGMLHVPDAQADLRLAPVREAVGEAAIDAVLAVPLVARGELIGLLAAYLPRGREITANETSLLAALASQLAVAVQNAQLHERTERLSSEREQALASERQSAKRLRALYEISRSFAQSLSLDATLEAVTRAAVELLEADAAVVRMEDERGDQLVPRAPYVADPRLAEPLRPLLTRHQPVDKLPGRRLFRMGKPLVLDSSSARRLGASYELLVPFLEQGSTAVIVPISTPGELLATLTVVSLDPERRIGDEEVETALFVAGQAALAIDNARLYQQQKDFVDTMQRSLLPRGLPEVVGLEVGAVYKPSARVEVGGDVYDFLVLTDGRLAVVLGDASGHGIEATADMALAKYAFRSLVRQYPDPGALLAQANEVAFGELAGGKFVTMVCVTVNPSSGEVRAASAGHPAGRVLGPEGAISTLEARGLALGVEKSQRYEEQHTTLAPGAALCLYTDGLVEVRREGEQFGEERLDAALAAGRELSAQALADHVVAEARAFAGEPGDDYAVVVIRRTEPPGSG
jgi:serine phosphatase RsbU (regulator of sigma subunit)